MLKKERFNAKYNTAMGQMPRSIERISSLLWNLHSVIFCFATFNQSWLLQF